MHIKYPFAPVYVAIVLDLPGRESLQRPELPLADVICAVYAPGWTVRSNAERFPLGIDNLKRESPECFCDHHQELSLKLILTHRVPSEMMESVDPAPVRVAFVLPAIVWPL
jgi:hypothetical protein